MFRSIRRLQARGSSVCGTRCYRAPNWHTLPAGPEIVSPMISPFETDYAVIGAGAAGSIVATRLAEKYPRASVTLFESGFFIPPSMDMVWNPERWQEIMTYEELEWGYKTIPQEHLENREIQQAQGRGTGGSSMHNAMVYVRGGRLGFDQWESNHGCVGWNSQTVFPYFEKVEDRVSVLMAEKNPFIQSVIDAAQNNDLPYITDYNAHGDRPCVSQFQFLQTKNPHGLRRVTSFDAFTEIQHRNLFISPASHVLSIDVNSSGRATAVWVVPSRGPFGLDTRVTVTKEVVLCGGAINSPILLMKSGIGPEAVLRESDIPVKIRLEGVGKNLQDDVFVSVGYEKKKELPLQPHGLMGCVIFDRTDHDDDLRTNIEASMGEYHNYFWFWPNIQLLRSRGEVTLSKRQAPQINPKYLDNELDVKTCVNAINKFRQIGQDSALQEWLGKEICPGSGDLETYVRKTADTTQHFAGTCKMGIDSMSVCDPTTLKVKGTENLRVVDASIIPATVSGNTCAATMMLAYKGADMI